MPYTKRQQVGCVLSGEDLWVIDVVVTLNDHVTVKIDYIFLLGKGVARSKGKPK